MKTDTSAKLSGLQSSRCSTSPLEDKENVDISRLVQVARKTGHKRNEKKKHMSAKQQFEDSAPKLNLSFKEQESEISPPFKVGIRARLAQFNQIESFSSSGSWKGQKPPQNLQPPLKSSLVTQRFHIMQADCFAPTFSHRDQEVFGEVLGETKKNETIESIADLVESEAEAHPICCD